MRAAVSLLLLFVFEAWPAAGASPAAEEFPGTAFVAAGRGVATLVVVMALTDYTGVRPASARAVCSMTHVNRVLCLYIFNGMCMYGITMHVYGQKLRGGQEIERRASF